MSTDKPLILVVDDDRLVLATVVAGLKQAEFEIIETDNGDDAILLARKHKPALALLDMRMQGKSGMDVARYLAANTNTGFMFLSAFGDTDIVEEATRLGALGYLVKPLDVKQIVPAVRAALARLQERVGEGGGEVPSPVANAAPKPAASSTSSGAGLFEQHVATGMLMERLHLDYDRALEALRAQARVEERSVEDLAASMLEAARRAAAGEV